jgi:ABC-type cobalamin/Fe3+-siderophores transport system ATPase subunit
MIAVEGLHLRAGDRTLFDDLTFTVLRGQFAAILGPNGVGKTTLLRTLAGAHPFEDGSVRIDSAAVADLTACERAKRLAYMASDDLFLDRLSVRDVVAMGRYPHRAWWQWREDPSDRTAILNALAAVRMESFAERFFDTLSSGERQRVWLALGLAQEVPILLLDEPTSHLDVGAAQEILGLLRAQSSRGKTVVCVLHDLNEAAAFSDRLLLLGPETMLAFDAPEAVLDPVLLERAYGVPMERTHASSGALHVFPKNVSGVTGADRTN